MNTPALYRCRIMHRRPGPPRYRFAYRAFFVLLDIDAIDAACGVSPLISRNRFNLLSFYDADHGPHDGSDLRTWIDGVLAEHGVALAGGRVRLLSMPRVLGYGFNPISLYYAEHRDGTLRAIVAEVHNTFGEHHVYVLHENGEAMDWRATREKAKQFHVSPFFDRSGTYRFHVMAPGERVGLGIRLYDEAGTLRIATALSGTHRPLNTRSIGIAACLVPLMTLKVTAAIHWQALKIWLRGATFHTKPKPRRPNRS
ncbi:DUF1365 domain-containing protein [Salinisphaera hydrothermalis]|uniref:DUF1365 domain-containing protein n=1 Tax=Salinisphaera hydrothermalis TaxID=563188 RepID=UPI00333EB9D3